MPVFRLSDADVSIVLNAAKLLMKLKLCFFIAYLKAS